MNAQLAGLHEERSGCHDSLQGAMRALGLTEMTRALGSSLQRGLPAAELVPLQLHCVVATVSIGTPEWLSMNRRQRQLAMAEQRKKDIEKSNADP